MINRGIYLLFGASAIAIFLNCFFFNESFMDVDMINKSQLNMNVLKSSSGDSSSSQTKCLHFDKEMDALVKSSNQIFITMPAKVAGTSLKAHVRECVRFPFKQHYINNPGTLPELLTFKFNTKKVIASHLLNETTFVDLAKHTTRETLLIYIYRNEHDRLLSAVKHVVASRMCMHVPDPDDCTVNENDIVELIGIGKAEISWGNTKIMTCSFYDAIAQNQPNLVFMHYKQSNRLQELVSKYFCPDVEVKMENVGSEKKDVSVQINNGDKVNLEDWVYEKRDIIEYTMKLNANATCVAETKTLELSLLSCPDELMQPVYKTKPLW